MHDEIDDEAPAHVPSNKGIYLLPNLFTTSSIFSGFYAVVAAMRGQYDYAAIAIFVSMIMDTLDGRVARMTNTQSAFGAQYDSMSDIVAFGVAPALVVYSWGLSTLGKIGWLAAFFYTAATALRLARFNTYSPSVDKRYFQGLPCPSAAAVIIGMVWVAHEYGVPGKQLAVLAAVITTLIATLMVSNVRFHSFKEIDLKGKVPFVAVLAVLGLFMFISIDPPQVLLIIFGSYALSGPLLTFRKWFKNRK